MTTKPAAAGQDGDMSRSQDNTSVRTQENEKKNSDNITGPLLYRVQIKDNEPES